MSLKPFKPYDVRIVGLNETNSHFVYTLNDDFFGLFEESLIQQGQLSAQLTLHAETRQVRVEYDIQGTVTLICDRTLAPFAHPIQVKETVLFEFGEREEIIDDNVYMIPHHTIDVNMAQHLYDFITLAVPMKKLHPLQED